MSRVFTKILPLMAVLLLIASCGQAAEPNVGGATGASQSASASGSNAPSASSSASGSPSGSASASGSASGSASASPSGSDAVASVPSTAQPTDGSVQLRMTWYNDGNEGDVMRDLLNRFEAENPGIKVALDTVAYRDLHNILQAQVEAGTAPDLARFTDAQRFAGNYLDMRPLMQDADAWAQNWPAARLQFLRKPDDTQGIYGFPMQYTVTGMFINRTLFEQANVAVPSDTKEQVTWQEWVDAGKQVAQATQTPYAVSIDRTGQRFWPISLSMCADYLDDQGKFTVDTPGFRQAAQMLVSWHTDRITPLEVWAGGGGGYAAANEFFVNGQSVWYFSGNWQVGQFAQQIGDKFTWDVVPAPFGECGSTAIPGGALIGAFKSTKHPQEVTRLVEFLTQAEIVEEFSSRSLFLPARLDLIEKGIQYPSNNDQLGAFLKEVPKITPEGDTLAVHPHSFTLNTAIRDRLSQVIVGELTLDDAVTRIQQAMDEATVGQ